MKEKYHKWIIALFAAVLAFGIGYSLGFLNALNWVIQTAQEHFDFNVSINRGELAAAIWRYKNAIG